MELIRGWHNLRAERQACAVTIGNFDGVHIGHQQLLKNLQQQARVLHLPTTVITFEPQPNEYFAHERIPPRLMRLREKLQVFAECGIDRVLCLRFNQSLSAMNAEDFVRQILFQGLATRYVLVGDDFHFGHCRAGDFALLKQLGTQLGFQVEQMHPITLAGERVSSSHIRRLLMNGDLQQAEQLLGRPYSLSGRVAYGDKRGRIMGFPTANIYLHRKAVPINGVYVVKMYGIRSQPLQGVANVGTRPTFDGTRSLLEVHLFDFDEIIYGRHVQVEFIHKLRDEQRYPSFELLKQQIFRDAEQARKFFLTPYR
ncbi:MAG: bifunctional riboflavin kinase/FAD synthetase [Gammaproteobacteria bacterium]